jgi:rRNA processing protein Gar1
MKSNSSKINKLEISLLEENSRVLNNLKKLGVSKSKKEFNENNNVINVKCTDMNYNDNLYWNENLSLMAIRANKNDDVIGKSDDDIIGKSNDVICKSDDDIIGKSNDVICKSDDDIIGKSDDVIGKSDDDIIGKSDDDIIGKSDDDIIGKSDDVIGKSDDVMGKSDDTIGKSDDVIGKSNDDIIGKSDDVIGKSNDDIIGKSDDTIGKSNDDIIGKSDDTIGKSDDIIGKSNDVIGKSDDISDYFFDKNKLLTNICMECSNVCYSGEGEIINDDSIKIILPHNKIYTELTIQLTPIYNGDKSNITLYTSKIEDNIFTVYATKNVKFYWMVYGKHLI